MTALSPELLSQTQELLCDPLARNLAWSMVTDGEATVRGMSGWFVYVRARAGVGCNLVLARGLGFDHGMEGIYSIGAGFFVDGDAEPTTTAGVGGKSGRRREGTGQTDRAWRYGTVWVYLHK